MKICNDVTGRLAERGITEIVHFTSNFGLLGCLEAGKLLSRRKLPEEHTLKHVLKQTSPVIYENQDWFDKSQDWLDYVNMSVSDINSSYYGFARNKWHINGDRFWIIMSFDSQIAAHDGVFFSTTNNVYPGTKRHSGISGFDNMFVPKVHCKGSWYVSRAPNTAPHHTTCEQAEVLYPTSVDMHFLRRIYVEEGEHADWVYMLLKRYDRPEVAVIEGKEKFEGCKRR